MDVVLVEVVVVVVVTQLAQHVPSISHGANLLRPQPDRAAQRTTVPRQGGGTSFFVACATQRT